MRALLAAALLVSPALSAQAPPRSGAAPSTATRSAFIDNTGVMRWRDDRSEVTLFGANYVLPTASDYRVAGYVRGDRKKMIDEDMAHFARMGWNGMRLTFWGDWQASDSAGNLIANEHLDLQDYLIARARERGIYMLFSPIQLYSANWPDAMAQDPATPGFGRVFGKQRMGTDPAARASQVNYLRQILNHVNPYTGVALKDEPAIIFTELVNEPWHHPEDLPGSIAYINALTDAVRSTGHTKPIFYNVSQDFRIGEAIRRSKAQGITFGWYPTGLNSGAELQGNYLRSTDTFPDMLRPELAPLPRIVYEFDSPDLRNATMYPAMARTMRSVGGQAALMFAYDMQGTASRNLGWQTHYLSMVYTPRKTVSAMIAAEAMYRLPRMRSYGKYPENTRFGDFRLSYDGDLAELVASDAFLYAGSTRSAPKDPAVLQRIAGYGSSPTVSYEGEGIYFLDKVRPGLWRLEVYPDAVPVRDPFEPPSPGKVVTRAISRAWPMTVALPDLGQTFTVAKVGQAGPAARQAVGGKFTVEPGVYVLSATGAVDPASLPARIGQIGFAEFHAPPPDSLPLVVQPLAAPEYLTGRDAELVARVVDTAPPDSVLLFVKPVAGGWFQRFWMRPAGAYLYSGTVTPAALREGPNEFVITAFRGGVPTTFPGGVRQRPWDWDFHARETWKLDAVAAGTPLTLFTPRTDAARLTFTRIGDAGRRGLFRLGVSPLTGQPVFHLELPVDSSGWSPADYTTSLVIKERIGSRKETISAAEAVRIRLRGLGARQTLRLTLMEEDGTSWTTAVAVDSSWKEHSLPLAGFTVGRGVLLPQGFPGEWSYWVGPAAGRGGAGDRPRLDRIERLQLSLRREEGVRAAAGKYGIEVESISLQLGSPAASGARGEQSCCSVVVRARVPEGTGAVYLAGNLPQLGPWRPDGLRMVGAGPERTARLTVPSGTDFEYKFTLGSWDREALSPAGAVPPNHRLAVSRDTTVGHELSFFKRDPRDYIADWKGSGVLGRLVYWTEVTSVNLGPKRHVEIWLPPGYDSTTARYPVIYMHDGQNLFDPRIANTGVDWGVDEAVMRLVGKGVMPPVIVVGVWNSAERGPEYSPWAKADRYARFLIEELMPRVNREFRTRTGPRNTAVIGSSMGGLLSFHLVTRHPDVFGACGCVSTHFPLSESVMARVVPGSVAAATPDTTPYIVRDIEAGLRVPKGARYWFDYGTVGLDAEYGPTHRIVREWLLRQGLAEGRDFAVRRYEGATHNEAAWRARLDDVLTFLFGPRR